MRILALVPKPYDSAPNQRFRVEQWARCLEAEGVQVEWDVFEPAALTQVLYRPGHALGKAWLAAQALLSRWRRLSRTRGYDLVLIVRESALVGPALIERWLRWRGIPYVFDFDDAIFLPDANSSNRRWQFVKCTGKTAPACRLAAAVIAGNRYLADYATQFNANVSVVPSTIDLDRYPPRRQQAGAVPVIVWTGSHTTAGHLQTLAPALARLAATRAFRLRVIGVPDFEMPGVPLEVVPWRSATEAQDLQAADIGIMPLPDNPWTRGKCGMKALQYMALGIPPVCSPVGMNADLIVHGENGLLAASEDEWVAALTRLLDDAELRRRLGAAARETVVAGYTAAVQAPRVLAILKVAANLPVVRTGNGDLPAPAPQPQGRSSG